MTILWCGGEEIDFLNTSCVSTSNLYRSDYARRSILRSGYLPLYSSIFTESSSMWLSWRMQVFTPGANIKAIGLVKSGTNDKGIFFGTSNDAYKAGIWKYDGSSWTLLIAETGASFNSNSYPVRFDLYISNIGASSTIKLYYQGNLLINGQVDSSISGIGVLDQLCIISTSMYLTEFSEIIVADEDTRLMSLKTIAPNAIGDTNNWSNSYDVIDETVLTTSDTIYSASNDADFQCNLTGMPAGNYSIKAVKEAIYCVDALGSLGVQIGIKTNGSINVGETLTTPSGFWEIKERLMNLNPVTGLEWTPAEIESLQLNFRSKVL